MSTSEHQQPACVAAAHGGRVAIIGAGLAGSMLALMLARDGYGVDVYERRSDPRLQSAGAGRSINLGLSRRGMQTLAEVGLLDEVLQRAVAMRGRVIHAIDGSTRFQAYGKDEREVLHSVDRNELNRLLLDHAARHPQVRLHFGHRLASVDKALRELTLDCGASQVRVRPLWVAGADGAFSSMRREMQRGERADYHQEYLEWGYKEMRLPPLPDGHSAIELRALHVWPRGHCLFVSHPNRDGSHTLTLFLPFKGEDSFDSVRTADEVHGLFAKYFPDLVPLLPSLIGEWMTHEVGALVTTRTTPWAFGDWAVLVGDACHAVYPFYGQGMNSAFEDCSLLRGELRRHGAHRERAFHAYESIRRPHTDVLCELSKSNFDELRQKVQSARFLARKRLDIVLNKLMPGAWLPLYTMIAHSTMPYGEALARSRRQGRILAGACLLAVAGLCAGLAFTWRHSA
jgi:kynurenine 3-monooxygenase